MKQRIILYGLTLMLGCFVLASCINDEEGPCLSDGKAQVVFSLVLQDNAQTRAEDWGHYQPQEPGVGYDNLIDPESVLVLLFQKAENNAYNYVDKLSELTFSQLSDSVYQFIGTAPATVETGDYKFVVLANCQLDGDPDTLDDLAELPFDYLVADKLPNIPMWGTKGIDAETKLTVEPGTRQDIGEIRLLRAVSKVTVRFGNYESLDDLRGYSLDTVTVSNYNKSGYVLPSKYDVTYTNDLEISDAQTLHVNGTKADVNRAFTPTGKDEITFYLPEYLNVGTDATPAKLMVTLSKTVGEGADAKTQIFKAPIEFKAYENGVPTDSLYNIVRNHYYQYNIYKVSDDGELYVLPKIEDWKDADPLEYTIDMSTNMRLFDSWLYRFDTDSTLTVDDWTNWATSHMLVSSGRTGATQTDTIAGRPVRSPQIQLVTNASQGSFELYVDNDDFEIVRANKNDVGVVTSYEASVDGTLAIAAGEDVYTYFYIVPKEGEAPANPVAHVFLYYNDPALGKLEMTYNYGSLPGYSDDSSEIWVYYVAPDDYKLGTGVLRMYYQDADNPLVPTPVQN